MDGKELNSKELNNNELGFLKAGTNEIDTQVGRYAAKSLAYIGDAVFELLVRGHLLKNGGTSAGEMTGNAAKIVRAKSQSDMYHKLTAVLTETELTALKRGRNVYTRLHPKNASVSEYRHATGVEALFGYLYVKGDIERVIELFGVCMEKEIKL